MPRRRPISRPPRVRDNNVINSQDSNEPLSPELVTEVLQTTEAANEAAA